MAEAIEVSLDWSYLSVAFVEAVFVGAPHEAVREHDLPWLVYRYYKHMRRGYFEECPFRGNTYELQAAWRWGKSWTPYLMKTSGLSLGSSRV